MKNWRKNAVCLGAPSYIFIPDNEAPYPSKAAMEYCNGCPVRSDCLAAAFLNNEQGVWGGTSTWQRRQMARTRKRQTCPSCASSNLVIDENKIEMCLACGISWNTTKEAVK
jgi:WhiB family redox-sensing transcriptional regulator